MPNTDINLANYYRRDTAHEEQILFRAGLGLQSPELNEMQAIHAAVIRRIADRIMSDGAIISGGAVVIDADTGATTCATAEIYLRGRVRDVAERKLTIPTSGTVEIGVWLTETVVTELEDPTLRDPCEGTRNYDEPGAARLRVSAVWGLSTDGGTGNFYRVYDVEDGHLKIKTAPPDLSGFAAALARYDRDNNGGHYVIDGLRLVWVSATDTEETYSLQEGKAHVYGHEIELATALRLRYPFDPDLQLIQSEPHQYNGGATGKMRVNVDRAPIHDVRKLTIHREKTETVLHGSYAGVADALPDPAVIEIVKVQQGGTTYKQTKDYNLVAGQVDWSPAGAEPAPGSSYSVTYRHIVQVEPIDLDERGFTVENAVPGSLVQVDYQTRLPRTDTLTLDRKGNLTRIKGMPRRVNPKAPPATTGQLELAQLHHTWFKDAPTAVRITAIVAVSMGTLQDMRRDIFDLYDLVASLKLQTKAIATAPAATRGVFVDPFLDDAMRDLGQSQTAAIVNGELMLPIRADVAPLSDATAPLTLPFRKVVLVEQTARTGHMRINPYSAFDPIPATVTLTPPVDYWTQTETVNGADVTRIFGSGGATRTSESIERRTVGTRKAETLRPISITFRAEGFRPDEEIRRVIFDGIELAVEAA